MVWLAEQKKPIDSKSLGLERCEVELSGGNDSGSKEWMERENLLPLWT